MKTAYELAMERLNKLAPTVKLTTNKSRRWPSWTRNTPPAG